MNRYNRDKKMLYMSQVDHSVPAVGDVRNEGGAWATGQAGTKGSRSRLGLEAGAVDHRPCQRAVTVSLLLARCRHG